MRTYTDPFDTGARVETADEVFASVPDYRLPDAVAAEATAELRARADRSI